MSVDGAVEVERIWKRFHADRGRPVLRDEIERLRAGRKGRESRWRWVLRDVSFRVQPGEAVALFGVNGSGKSTLLKILTQVMYQSAGRVDVAGRVGALIEIKAGIHPDLTGRENIHLYGSLLGLSRKDVSRRFDEIVAFAELEDAIDRQVKFYSSGMGMRLGFGVAAFLEPHVLLVDEVLAVGDASFQQKCLDRIRTVVADGTTLVFVSHDLATIEAACDRGIWLHEGTVAADTTVTEALTLYRSSIEHRAEADAHAGPVRLALAGVTGRDGAPRTGEGVDLDLDLIGAHRGLVQLDLGLSQGPATPILTVSGRVGIDDSPVRVRLGLDGLPVPGGRYYLWALIRNEAGEDLIGWHPVGSFLVEGPELQPPPRGVSRLSPVYIESKLEVLEG